MKKLLVIAACAWISIGVVTAAGWIPSQTSIAVNAEQAAAPAAQRPAQRAAAQTPPAAPAAAAPAQAAPPVVNPAEYKAMVKTYCTTCHNERAKIPAGAPLALDLADLDDPSKTAEVWEKVIRKLGIGAMPPQGMPSPGTAKLAEFRTWLAGQLDRAAVARGNPGQFVVHRMNRLEYQNAMRDLLGLEIDATELLPSDGGDFGFDNIATALNTSPLLLERYLTAALRVSALAVGDTTTPARPAGGRPWGTPLPGRRVRPTARSPGRPASAAAPASARRPAVRARAYAHPRPRPAPRGTRRARPPRPARPTPARPCAAVPGRRTPDSPPR
jgi:cytochrome c5